MIYFHKKQNLIETKNKNSICVIHPMITKKHNERLFSAMNFHTHFKQKKTLNNNNWPKVMALFPNTCGISVSKDNWSYKYS